MNANFNLPMQGFQAVEGVCWVQIGDVIGSLLAAQVLELGPIGQSILAAGSADAEEAEEGEDSPLVDSGLAGPVIAAALKQLAGTAGEAKALEAWKAAGLHLEEFLPSVSYQSDLCHLLDVCLDAPGVRNGLCAISCRSCECSTG